MFGDNIDTVELSLSPLRLLQVMDNWTPPTTSNTIGGISVQIRHLGSQQAGM